MAIAPSVIVRDVNSNPVAGVSVTFAVATGGGAVVPTSPLTTNASGIAQVTSWTLGTAAGANTLTATSGSLAGSPVTFTATGVAGAATQIAISGGNAQSATAGTAVATAPSVIVRDVNSNPVPGVSVTFAVATGGGAVVPTTAVTTNASGIAQVTSWTLGTTAGANTLTATATGLTGSPVTFTATGMAGTATQVAVNGGNGQSATVNTTVATAPSVIVRDVNNNPVTGVSVTFAVATGGGTVVPTTAVTTNASGIAQVTSWRLGTVSGPNTLTATSGSLTGSPVTFTATGTAGTATQIALTVQPSATAASGTALATQPAVQLKDALGNGVAGVTVTAGVVSGTPTITNGTAITNAAGTATFSGLALTGTLASYQLRFSGAGLGPVTATQATALATKLALTTEPSTATWNSNPLRTQPVVQLQDVNGAAVAVPGVTVTAGVVSGAATLTNGTAITNAAGTATFTGLALTGTLASYQFTFSATGLSQATAAVGTALATKLAVTAQPATGALTTVFLSPQPEVQVQDVNGNPVDGVGLTITAGAVSGTVTILNGAVTILTASTAFWTGLTLVGTDLSYTLVFTAPGLTPATAAAPTRMASKLILTTQPSTTAASGVPLASQPVVQLADAANSPVGRANMAILVEAVSSVGVTIGNAQLFTDASGTATYTALTLTAGLAPQASYQLTFNSDVIPQVVAAAPTALGTQLTLSTQPSTTGTSGVALVQQPVVQLRDATGAPVALAGIVVTASVATGTGTVTAGVTATTNASGTAKFSGLAITGTGSNTLQFASGVLTLATALAPTVLP